jgi:3-hydroxyacyl-CoA dehydrogenase
LPDPENFKLTMAASAIRTVGVVGTGVIGSSWTTLFLSKGLKVIVSDPAPGAKEHLDEYIKKAWPEMKRIGLDPGASPSNYEFVDDVANHLDEVDFVQEVSIASARHLTYVLH